MVRDAPLYGLTLHIRHRIPLVPLLLPLPITLTIILYDSLPYRYHHNTR